jgi:hypothetical protein
MCFGGLVTTTAAVKLGHGAVLHGCITHVGSTWRCVTVMLPFLWPINCIKPVDPSHVRDSLVGSVPSPGLLCLRSCCDE